MQRQRSLSRHVFAVALLGSLLAHGLIFGQAGQLFSWSSSDMPEEISPIEARLDLPSQASSVISTPAKAVVNPQPPAPVLAQAAPPALPAELPVSIPPSLPTASLPPPPDAEVAQGPAPTPVPPPQQAEPVVAEKAAPTSTPLPSRARNLPTALNLTYDVLAGENSFNLGQAVYSWQVEGDRYVLESSAEAKGLVSLFMSGRIVQGSRGHIGPAGLIPEVFSMEKSTRRQESARFDWPQRQLHLASGVVALPEGAQDLLSFPFHLAMTVSDEDVRWTLPVTNGRKLKDYSVEVLGHERIEMNPGSLDTLHVQCSRSGEGTLDVWLAPSRHWLPVRIRTQDQKGKIVVLTLRSE